MLVQNVEKHMQTLVFVTALQILVCEVSCRICNFWAMCTVLGGRSCTAGSGLKKLSVLEKLENMFLMFLLSVVSLKWKGWLCGLTSLYDTYVISNDLILTHCKKVLSL